MKATPIDEWLEERGATYDSQPASPWEGRVTKSYRCYCGFQSVSDHGLRIHKTMKGH